MVWAILVTIFTCQRYGKKVGFCGQGVSNNRTLRGVVSIAGITTASVVPDTYYQTKLDVAQVESENICISKLGQWISNQLLDRLGEHLEAKGYEHIHKKYKKASDIMDWYEGELARLADQLRKSLDSDKEDFYRQEMELFRANFHKPVIYAAWDWDATVKDALNQAGFSSFDEQKKALADYRAKQK